MTQNELMQALMAADFAVYELQLYLDTHPDSVEALVLLAQKQAEAKSLRDEYERRFGPLTAINTPPTRPWRWNNAPWPWERPTQPAPPRPEPPRPPQIPRPEPPRPQMPPRPMMRSEEGK